MHDDNLPRAQRAADIVGDDATHLSASASRMLFADERSTLSLGAEARAAAYDRYHGLSSVALGAKLSGRHKLGIGLTVPWLEASVAAARESYREPLRDGDRMLASFAMGKRFGETFDAAAGFRYDRRESRNDLPVGRLSGRSFDLQGRSVFARAGYAATDRLLLSFGYALRDGDVVSSTRRNLAIFRASNAISADPAFGPDYFTYRLSGTTRSASVGASWAIDDQSSISASFAADRTRASAGLNYNSTLFGVHYAYRH